MPSRMSRAIRPWLTAVALACSAGAVRGDALAAAPDAAVDVATQRALAAQLRAFKQAELDALAAPAMRELRERHDAARVRPSRRRPGARPSPAPAARAARAVAAVATPGALAHNVRVNPGAGFWTQAEPGLAALGELRLAAWNDGALTSTIGTLGAAYSTDAGAHWTAVTPPLDRGILRYEGDPVIAADPVRGEFWLCSLAVAGSPAANAIAVVRAAITDTGLVWRGVEFPRAVRDTLPDKPWLDIDPATGDIALAYTTFWRGPVRSRDQIELVRRGASGVWSPPIVLSSPAEEGFVQGARVAYGPDGTLHALWAAVDTTVTARGRDTLRVRTSRDGGATFGRAAAVAGIVVNFGSGAPGFNRTYGLVFPSLAVDRSDRETRGRVYVAWTESVDFYAQRLGAGRRVVAGPGATFAWGDLLCGNRAPGAATDRFAIDVRRGQTAVFLMDSVAATLDVQLGAGCSTDDFELARSAPPSFGRPRALVVTFPRDGRYTLNVASEFRSGGYRVLTGLLQPDGRRGRDVRDVFVASSRDARVWDAPVRVSDAPPWWDDFLPEVTTGPHGEAYVACTTGVTRRWRNAACARTSTCRVRPTAAGRGTRSGRCRTTRATGSTWTAT